MSQKKRLIILDLDHTLVYASFDESESAPWFFQYSKYMKVYTRPFAQEFIAKCKTVADVIVFTTAERNYAAKICEELEIQPVQLITRENTPGSVDIKFKMLNPHWLNEYDRITIVDDSPNIWDTFAHEHAEFIVPPEFMGDKNDTALKNLNF